MSDPKLQVGWKDCFICLSRWMFPGLKCWQTNSIAPVTFWLRQLLWKPRTENRHCTQNEEYIRLKQITAGHYSKVPCCNSAATALSATWPGLLPFVQNSERKDIRYVYMLGTCARSRGPPIEREKTKTSEGICNTCQVANHCLGDHSTLNVPLTVLTGKQSTNTVHTSLKAMRHLTKEGKIPDMEETDTLDNSPSAQ